VSCQLTLSANPQFNEEPKHNILSHGEKDTRRRNCSRNRVSAENNAEEWVSTTPDRSRRPARMFADAGTATAFRNLSNADAGSSRSHKGYRFTDITGASPGEAKTFLMKPT
jgi:hypothetical protein